MQKHAGVNGLSQFPIFEEKISQMWQLPHQTASDLHPVKVALRKSP